MSNLDGVVANSTAIRDQLIVHHTQLGEQLVELGKNMQAFQATWAGPANDGFAAYKNKLAAWCAAGQTFLDAIANVHTQINNAYSTLNS